MSFLCIMDVLSTTESRHLVGLLDSKYIDEILNPSHILEGFFRGLLTY